ncbi:CHRD domain-containing protein [Nitrosovibrio tenuis]|uniref:PEP-CTERM protein-sorting domain-containing protein n=1 Tax=Nitrosovibrio tenuis TaxID=1233 RepID=A0A1H7JDX1_9PROT|nr:CHRD domain-containing protein [Nitrosovibrio tenuis]SEK71575.1 PEP-CTERM protein-sorting domain-containing protein [Nitrosovibrio tenuis]
MKMNLLFTAGLLAAAVAPPAAALDSIYTAQLNGPSEFPTNSSPGTGSAIITINLDQHTMRVQESFSGLTANTTAAHIHCCTAAPDTAGVATTIPTFPEFPLNVTEGSYDHTFDMTLASSYNMAFIVTNGGTVSGAFDALVAGLDHGTAYSNIHTSAFPGGEIRGFLAPVPEPEAYAMLMAGLAAISLVARRRRG